MPAKSDQPKAKRRFVLGVATVIGGASAAAGVYAPANNSSWRNGDTLVNEIRYGNSAGLAGRVKGVLNPLSKDSAFAMGRTLFWGGLGVIGAGKAIRHVAPRWHRGIHDVRLALV